MKIILKNSTLSMRYMLSRTLKTSTVEFLSKYTKVLNKGKLAAVEDMLDALGYGEENSIWSKIEVILLPFLSNDVSECLYNAKNNINIFNAGKITTDVCELVDGKLLIPAYVSPNYININYLLTNPAKIGNTSLGYFGVDSTERLTFVGGSSNVGIAYYGGTNILQTSRSGKVYKSGVLTGDSVCISISSTLGNFSKGADLGTYSEMTPEILDSWNTYYIGSLVQEAGATTKGGFKAFYKGAALTETELNTIYTAINTCITKILE